MKCRPRTSPGMGPRAIPSRARSMPMTKGSSTRLRATRIADRHNPFRAFALAPTSGIAVAVAIAISDLRPLMPTPLNGRSATRVARSGMNEPCVTSGAVRGIRSCADQRGFEPEATPHGVPFPGDDAPGNGDLSKRLSFAY